MKPNDIPQWVMNNAMEAVAIAQGSEIEVATEIIAYALLNAYQRGENEKQIEIDRLNQVIERMQKTMSSQAEQWTRSMAAARREAMEEAAKVARSAFDDRRSRYSMDWNDGFDDGTKAAEDAIRAKVE